MTPETMRQRSAEVNAKGEEYNNVIEGMRRITNELMTEWEGQASRSFNDQFQALQPSFQKMRELFTDISTQLNKTAQIVEETDRQIASQMGVR